MAQIRQCKRGNPQHVKYEAARYKHAGQWRNWVLDYPGTSLAGYRGAKRFHRQQTGSRYSAGGTEVDDIVGLVCLRARVGARVESMPCRDFGGKKPPKITIKNLQAFDVLGTLGVC